MTGINKDPFLQIIN